MVFFFSCKELVVLVVLVASNRHRPFGCLMGHPRGSTSPPPWGVSPSIVLEVGEPAHRLT